MRERVCLISFSRLLIHTRKKLFVSPSVYIFWSEILFLVCQPGARRALLLLVNRRTTMDGMYIIALRLAAGISWQIYTWCRPFFFFFFSFCFAHTWKDLRRWSDRQQQSPVFHLSLYSALCGDTQLVWFRCAVVFFTRTFPLLCTHIYNGEGV